MPKNMLSTGIFIHTHFQILSLIRHLLIILYQSRIFSVNQTTQYLFQRGCSQKKLAGRRSRSLWWIRKV